MDTQIIFWVLVTIALIELFVIYGISGALVAMLRSDALKKKIKKAEMLKKNNEDNNLSNLSKLILILVLLSVPSLMFASDNTTDPPLSVNVSNITLYFLLAFDVFLFGIIFYIKNLTKTINNIGKTKEELEAKKVKKEKIDFVQLLTDTVPLEYEHMVETDHEYDGIRELDNNLPPWWKWGFYLTIFIGIVYLLNYHVFKTGDLQIEAYEKEMRQANIDIQEYLKSQAMNVDENTVVMLNETADLAAGEKLFMNYCKVCHGEKGEGIVGPNLADNYWIYGGKINSIFKTIKYGAENGMKSWKDELNPVQIQQVSSYIKSLQGTNPPNAKEPQGEFYIEEGITQLTQLPDSLAVDTLDKN
jgi:cytochrome c oxidase cbb3-type subunit 3